MEALGTLGFLLLTLHAAACVALVVTLAREKPPWRAAVALAVPPLGALWVWETGHKRRALAYVASLGAFALWVAAVNVAR